MPIPSEIDVTSALDTIVVPAHPEGFNSVFYNKQRWQNVRIDKNRLKDVKFIAVYQTKPVSAITHYAEIARFEPLELAGRYDVFFNQPPVEVGPIPYTSSDICAVQGPRYTRLELVRCATHLAKAFPN